MSLDQTGVPAPDASTGGEAGGENQVASPPAPSRTEPAGGEAAGGEPETFKREYVEQLRRENAQHRTRSKPYEEAFSGYTEAEQQYLLGIVRGLNDPASQSKTAAELKEIAERILGAQEPVRPNGEPDPEAQPLTIKQYNEMRAREATEREQAEAIKGIETEATQLGFPPMVEENGVLVPNMRYSMLLHAAQVPEVAGDMKKAAERVAQYEKSIIDAHAQRLQEESKKWPAAAGTTGSGAPAEPQERPNWKRAGQQAIAWAQARAGQA